MLCIEDMARLIRKTGEEKISRRSEEMGDNSSFPCCFFFGTCQKLIDHNVYWQCGRSNKHHKFTPCHIHVIQLLFSACVASSKPSLGKQRRKKKTCSDSSLLVGNMFIASVSNMIFDSFLREISFFPSSSTTNIAYNKIRS